MKQLKFGKRQHRGGLKESLETSVLISEKEFFDLLPFYHFYAFDKRCNQFVFISNGFMYAEYHWLFIQI